ncbi:MAG: S1C family serine protease [Anaerolineae bacterium]
MVVGFDRQHLDQLIGQAQRPHLGAAVADASSMSGRGQAVPTEGAYVGRIRAGSPAAQAGLQVGDIITSIGGHAVRSAFDLESIVARIVPGQAVRIHYQRNAQDHETTIKF